MSHEMNLPAEPPTWAPGPPEPPTWPVEQSESEPPGPPIRLDPRLLAGTGIVLSVAFVLLSTVIAAFSSDGGPVGGNLRFVIKMLGLGQGFFGPSHRSILVMSTAGAAFIALALIVALVCAQGSDEGRTHARLVPVIAVGAAAEAGWLLLFTLLGLPVDLSLLGSQGFRFLAVALLGDLASAVLLSVTLFWAVQLFAGSRGRPIDRSG